MFLITIRKSARAGNPSVIETKISRFNNCHDIKIFVILSLCSLFLFRKNGPLKWTIFCVRAVSKNYQITDGNDAWVCSFREET